MSSSDVNSKHVEMNHHTIYISIVKLILLVIFNPIMKVVIFLTEELKHILRDISKRKSLPLDVTLLEIYVFGSMDHILEDSGIEKRSFQH